MEKRQRPSWDDYFFEVCEAIARRATCDRGRSGCVIVKDRQILATGYVGAPAGLPHCDDAGHLLKQVYVVLYFLLTMHLSVVMYSFSLAVCCSVLHPVYFAL